MENPPQCAQIAVYSDDGILRHVSPVPGIPAHQIARNLKTSRPDCLVPQDVPQNSRFLELVAANSISGQRKSPPI